MKKVKKKEILITKPDKGAGVVIVNKNEYNNKIKTILNDTTKFLDLGPATNNDNTAKIETQIQQQLLQLSNEKLIFKTEYKAFRLSATVHVRPSENSQKRCTPTSNFVNDRIRPA